jgi:hypothetical protein
MTLCRSDSRAMTADTTTSPGDLAALRERLVLARDRLVREMAAGIGDAPMPSPGLVHLLADLHVAIEAVDVGGNPVMNNQHEE